MRLLLDTHTLLWFALDDLRLSSTADGLLSDLKNEIFVSPATHWELAIKISIGKYALPVGSSFTCFVKDAIEGNGFKCLPIEPQHTELLAGMPFMHRDPFDRLLIAQAMAESMGVVSTDAAFDDYSITRYW